MTTSSNDRPHAGAARFFPALLVLFVGSGCAALIYEVVWFELLRQVIGASSVSLAILLASFMGGMCIGSVGFSRRVPHRLHPLLIYAFLEVGIGIVGIAMLVLLPAVQYVYVSVFGYGLGGIMLRGLVCLIALLPPTILMGATLPAVARWMKSTRTGVSRLGFLYMANLAGAVAGTLLAGFYLLRVYDMLVATLVALALNVIVAIVAAGLAMVDKSVASQPEEKAVPEGEPGEVPAESSPLGGVPDRALIYLVIGLSGLTALGAQVIWTRLLSLLMGATVFTFSIILAVFLIGLGFGSSAGAYVGRYMKNPARGLAWCQLLLVAAIPWAAFMINKGIPFWYVNPEFFGSILLRYQHDLLRTAVALLPATLLWGASFPLALAAASHENDAADRIVGDTYAANTLGAIIGSLAFGMVLLPWLGTHGSQQYLTLLAGLSAFALFALDTRDKRTLVRRLGTAAVVFSLAVWMSRIVVPTDPGLIGYGRLVEEWENVVEYHFVGEGRSTSVAVSDYNDGTTRSMHVGGKVVASNQPLDMRIERLLGHIPALVYGSPKTVLIVGFGAGVTAGSFVLYPDIERIVICEIEPLVPEAAGVYFAAENYDVVNDPRVEIIFDDARHFIATTDETFDVITSDPIHPWVRGAASLYSTEYFELVKQRLNPGGVVAQWVPLYETSEETVKSEMGTFFEAFPDGTVWNSDISGEGYDVVMLGQVEPTTIDVAALEDFLVANPKIRRSLADVDVGSSYALLQQYLGQARDMTGWLSDAEINHDRSLRLQYLAGLSVDNQDTYRIFSAIAQHRRYPENIFIAPPAVERQLRLGFAY